MSSKPVEPTTVKLSPEEERAWKGADFLLINPEHLAIAMRDVGTPTAAKFKVIAKASGEVAQRQISSAYDLTVPIIDQDKALTRRVYSLTDVGNEADDRLSKELSEWWRVHEYVPPDTSLVSFNDLRYRRKRVGFRVASLPTGFRFQELSQREPEAVEDGLVQPGTLLQTLSDAELRQSVDFLDYCLYHVRKSLTSKDKTRGHVAVGVEVPKDRVVKEASASLEASQSRLMGEIHERLSRLGIVAVERGDLLETTIRKEQDRWNSRGWKRPYDAEEARKQNLLGASHVLIAETRPAKVRGEYELYIRLVDVATAEIVWAGQGDRLNTAQEAIDLASSAYLLNTGKLMAVYFKPSVTLQGQSDFARLAGGFPLSVPDIRIVGASSPAPKRPEPPPIRRGRSGFIVPPSYSLNEQLGYVEGAPTQGGDTFQFRGLFDKHIQVVPKSAVSEVREVRSLLDVPPAHQMRHLVWRLSKTVVPTAGRVMELDGSRVHVSLKRADLIRPGDRLRALRPVNGGSSETVLPLELIVTEVHDNEVIALSQAQSSRETVSVGDVVHRQQQQKPAVAVLPVKLSPTQSSSGSQWYVVIGFVAFGGSKPSNAAIEDAVTVRMAGLIESALSQAHVVTVERSNFGQVLKERESTRNTENIEWRIDPAKAAELGKLSGATHVILAMLRPGADVTQERETPANFRIVDVATGIIAENIEYTFTRQQMDHWKP